MFRRGRVISPEKLEEAVKGKRLGVTIKGIEKDKSWETMGKIWLERSREMVPFFCERMVITTIMYGSKTWALNVQGRKLEMLELMCLKNVWGIRSDCEELDDYREVRL